MRGISSALSSVRVLVSLVLLAAVLHATPTQAIPYLYDLSGDIKGWVVVDFDTETSPYLQWNFSTVATELRPAFTWIGTAGMDLDNYNTIGDGPTTALLHLPYQYSPLTSTYWNIYVLSMRSDGNNVSFGSEGFPRPGGGVYITSGYGEYVRRGSVPEPETMFLVTMGILLLGAYEWRRTYRPLIGRSG